MDDEVAWVALQLRTYCLPTSHTFVALPGSGRWCTLCYKEEGQDERSCLICSVRAHQDAVLLTVEDQPALTGPICDVCRVGLESGSLGRITWRLLGS